MQTGNLKESLVTLGLSTQEAASLLGVNMRTIQRWLGGDVDIPVSVAHVMQAWLYLNKLGLPWRPDGYSVSLISAEEMRNQLLLHIQHVSDLADILKKVKNRGGPATPWNVDFSSKKATLGDIWVRFYKLPNGGFSPQSYGRYDKTPDLDRDKFILEDAYACIAEAIASRNKEYKEADWLSVEI
jgi:hypothetical protein